MAGGEPVCMSELAQEGWQRAGDGACQRPQGERLAAMAWFSADRKARLPTGLGT